ncbi:MAG TPA: PilN domain-containing protein [Candidatus Acidoferrum sp.]|nr:PilN domain-containing protein [Candidatus Acidoferrum sp.]
MLISGFNLAATDVRAGRRHLVLPAILAAVLVLLVLAQVSLWIMLRREAQSVAPRLAKMETEFRRHQEEVRAARAAFPPDAMKRYEAKVAVFNQILESSAFSWTGLLAELERSVPPGVTLKDIHPDLATGVVALHGVARSFDDLSRLLHTLGEQPTFRDVFLLRQSTTKATPNVPEALDFAVTLIYKGRG